MTAAAPARRGVVAPTAVIVALAVVIAWLMLTLLDLRDNDGAASLIGLFGVPALAAALIVQVVVDGTRDGSSVPRAVWWWVCGALPVGVLAAGAVAVVNDPDYFLSDGPAMLIWLVVFVYVALLIGALVWCFFVYPIVALVRIVPGVMRRTVPASRLALPLLALGAGTLSVIGGLSVDYADVGRAAWGAVLLSLLGIPGRYEVTWEPGLWIVRALVVVCIALLVWFARADRRASR